MEGYITTREAATIIGTDTNYVSQMCRNKVLNCTLSGGRWMVEKLSAEKYRLKKLKRMKKKSRTPGSGRQENDFFRLLKKAEPLIRKFGFEKFMTISEMVLNDNNHPESISKFWKSEGSTKLDRKSDFEEREEIDIPSDYQRSLFRN